MLNQTNAAKKPDYSLTLPSEVIEKIGMAGAESGTAHIFDHSLLLLKGDLSAAEIVSTCESLRNISTDLTVKLALACGPCTNCKICAVDPDDDFSPLSSLPESLLQMFREADVCLFELEGLLESEDAVDGE